MGRRIYLSTSSIHGRGVFAARDFQQGEVVGRYSSRKTKLTAFDNPYVIEVYDDDGVLLEHRIGTNDFRFINHSTTPNLEMGDDLVFIAARDIAKDEELTWFYGEEFEQDMLEDEPLES